MLPLLAACSNDEEYRLSEAQLAWQGYQAGQVLRFAQSSAGPVRAYRIASVQDRMEKPYLGVNFTPFPSRKVTCQHISVLVDRADTAAVQETALELELDFDQAAGADKPVLFAQAGWTNFYPYARLPLDELNKGLAFDTLQYPGLRLLPTATFGPSTYPQVIQVVNRTRAVASAPGARRTRVLYYARRKGVVAFEEEKSGPWYLLP